MHVDIHIGPGDLVETRDEDGDLAIRVHNKFPPESPAVTIRIDRQAVRQFLKAVSAPDPAPNT